MQEPTEKSVQELSAAFESARTSDKPSLRKLAEAYDEFILELDAVPQPVWTLLTTAFSDRVMLKRRGLERFLLEMNADQSKYSARQLQEFLRILLSNVQYMEHEIARHAAGDFIARAYPQEVAMKAFMSLAAGLPRDKHVALVGLDVLRHRADNELLPAVLVLHDDLLASESEWFPRV